MSKINFKHILFIVVLVGLQMSSLAVGEQINEPNYVELLNRGLERCYQHQNPYLGLVGVYQNLPKKGLISFNPIHGLDDPNAIPFLIEVLFEDPTWLPKNERHIAKCYAALCLGTTKDPRALEPLIEAMNTLDVSVGREYISGYAVWALGLLGDANAVEPLINAIKSGKKDISSRAPIALVCIGDLRAIEPILKTLEEKSQEFKERQDSFRKMFPESIEPNDFEAKKLFFDAKSKLNESKSGIREIDGYLSMLTKVKFEAESENIKSATKGTKDPVAEWANQMAITLPELWSQWWRGGPQFTRARLEAKHSEWKAMKKENQLEKSNANSKLSEMADLGIPAIPFMVEKVKQGETDFIPLISKLTNKKLAETATKEQCLAWWEANKQKWLIPFPEPDALPADPNK